ncbi:MAG: hypothetical protein V2A67_04390 [Bacteroidota bacterium]
MISAKYRKDMAFNLYAAEVFQEGAEMMLHEQRATAKTYLNRRTCNLLRHLESSPFQVMVNQFNATLILQYFTSVRFTDLRKTVKGKTKKVYGPIYNKIVWGVAFGHIYPQLRYGFTAQVREKYTLELRKLYNRPF